MTLKYLLIDTAINCAVETSTGDIFDSREEVADFIAEYFPEEQWARFAIHPLDLDKHITSEVLSEAREALLEKARQEAEAQIPNHILYMTPDR